MIYRFQSLLWTVGCYCSVALAKDAAIEAAQQTRNFTYESVTSSREETSITLPTSLSPGETLSPLISTSSTSLTLPYTLTLSHDQTTTTSISTSPTPSTFSSGYSTDVPWGPLQAPSPITYSSGDTTCHGCDSTFMLDPTSSATFAPSNISVPSSTATWSNSSTTSISSLTITSSPTRLPVVPVCQQGRKGCDSNTNTIKTAPPDDSTSSSDTLTSYYFNSTIPSTKTTSCDVTLSSGEPSTVWIVLPNTDTITLTVSANMSTTFSTIPEFTPPVYCYPTTSTERPFLVSAPGGAPKTTETSSQVIFPASSSGLSSLTIIVTSKNPVTVFTTDSPIGGFPGGPKTDKQTVTPTSDTAEWGPLTPPPPKIASDATTVPLNQLPTPGSGGGSQPLPTTTTISGISVIISSTQVVVGSQTVGNLGSGGNGPSSTEITQNGQTFTVNPSQVIGPGVTLTRPSPNGGVFVPTPQATPTVIAGISVQLAPSSVIIGGNTFSIGPGVSEQTTVVNGQTVVIGPQGLVFAQTTVAPPVLATNVVILDADVISAIGNSEAVIGGSTFFYGPSSTPETDTFNGEVITIGPSGISYGSSVLGGISNTGTQLGIAGGISVTELGSNIAIISGTTFIVGPGAISTTAVINGKTISAGENGLGVGGTTLSYPFNPATQVFTAGGITFSEIGSLVDIGGKTFTIGSSMTTTDFYNGQSISLGPGGVGFKTTTVTATSGSSPTSSAESTGKKKSGAGNLRPFHGVLGICIALGAGYNF